MALIGGIDLGGTKIEARLFDTGPWTAQQTQEIATPRGRYDALLAALAAQVDWLATRGAAGVGVGSPGLIDASGRMLTANLPASGRTLPADLRARAAVPVSFLNDCRAFTLSEARLGAGRGADCVLGLILGTGVAGGVALGGAPVLGRNGAAGEFGHTPLPHGPVAAHDLPVLPCGCGLTGCYETLCSGPGLSRLARHLTGKTAAPEDLATAGDETAERVLAVWAELLGHLLAGLVHTLDPDIVVLGGGLSKIEGLIPRLRAATAPHLLAGVALPAFALAEGGDRSGARGAALFAHMTTAAAAARQAAQ
ncbi:MAG: ROK family protein [Pseudomonadota bacterium]